MRTLVEMLNESFKENADRVAVRVLTDSEGGTLDYKAISYGELSQLRDRVAAGLEALGLSKGQRMGVLTDGGFEPILAFLACDFLGVSCVPLCLKTSPEILAYNVRHSGMAMLIVDRKGSELFANLDLSGSVRPLLINIEDDGDGTPSWQQLVRCENPTPVVDVSPDDETKILYTSGSSGMPKGVIQTHANIVANVDEVWNVVSERRDLRFFKSAPDYHSMGILNIYYPLAKGWTLDMARSPDRVLTDIRHSQPHAFLTVPLILDKVYGNVRKEIQSGGVKGKLVESSVASKQRLARGIAGVSDKLFLKLLGYKIISKIRSQLANRVGENLELLIVGSAKADPEALDFFHEVLDIKTFEGYGATECAPLISTNHLDGRVAGTVGRPLIRVRIVDREGIEIAYGDPESDVYQTQGESTGELWASGPNVMRGYLDDPEQTSRALVEYDGNIWYRTGDLFSMDSQGYLTFRGRLGRQFKLRNGEFVNPELLERIFSRASLVEHIVIFGDQQRDYPMPLVVIDVEEAKKILFGDKSSSNELELRTNDQIKELVRKQLLFEANNYGLPSYERPQRIVLLPEPLSEEDGTLTRGLKKVVPSVVIERYRSEIEDAYS